MKTSESPFELDRGEGLEEHSLQVAHRARIESKQDSDAAARTRTDFVVTAATEALQAERLLSLAVAVAAERSLERVLQTTVRGLASHPDVALARTWLQLPGDICDSCFMRAACRDRSQCLHL